MTGFAPDVDLSLLPRTFFTFVQCAMLSEQARIEIYKIKSVTPTVTTPNNPNL